MKTAVKRLIVALAARGLLPGAWATRVLRAGGLTHA